MRPTILLTVLTCTALLTACQDGVSGTPVNTGVFGGTSGAQGQGQGQVTITQPVTAVRVSGQMTLRLHAGDHTDLRRTVQDSSHDPGNTWRVNGSTLELDGCQGCSISYDVTVPRNTSITGDLGSGTGNLTGLASVDLAVNSSTLFVQQTTGPLRLRVNSGSAQVYDVGGPADVSASSATVRLGRVRGASTLDAQSCQLIAAGLNGPTTLTEQSADVSIGLASPQDVTANLSSGSLRLTVPQARYRVRSTNSSGSVNSSVPDDPAGTHQLQFTQTSASVTVNYG